MLELALPIAKPPWKKLGKKLESALRKALYDYRMLEGVTKLGIALSGGKDSLALLFLLHAIRGRGFPDFELYAIHVSGHFSCGPSLTEGYLKKICEVLEVQVVTCFDAASSPPTECYSCSRKRRRLIFEAAKNLGIEKVAFGHHRDDHAQTLLMNLLHKGEFAGNLPVLPMIDFGITILRPLIFISECDLKNFAKEYGFARITCQCPIGQNSMRKQVDHLLTHLESLFPNARANVAAAGLLYGSDKARRK